MQLFVFGLIPVALLLVTMVCFNGGTQYCSEYHLGQYYKKERGCRGSGHSYPISTVINSRIQESQLIHVGPVNQDNLVEINLSNTSI